MKVFSQILLLYLSGSIVSWIWDFGDGNYDSGPLVSHLYQETDLFNINLYVKSEVVVKILQVKIYKFSRSRADFEFYPYSASILSPEISFFNMSENVSNTLEF